ncbi:MAG: hypothetical protein QXJ24_06820 [Thermoplasmatales archaeon]
MSSSQVLPGEVFYYAIQNKLSGYHAYFIDNEGNQHTAQVSVGLINSTTLGILVADGSNASYTATTLVIGYSQTNFIVVPYSATKQSNTSLTYLVQVSVSGNPSWLAYEIMVILGGVSGYSYTVSASATLTTYNSSSGTCESTVSSTSSVTPTISYSYTAQQTIITLSYSLSSCQSITFNSLTISDNQSNSYTYDINQTSSVCTSSCTATAQVTINI